MIVSIYNNGKQAFLDGKLSSDCPFTVDLEMELMEGTTERGQWLKGFLDEKLKGSIEHLSHIPNELGQLSEYFIRLNLLSDADIKTIGFVDTPDVIHALMNKRLLPD